MLPVHFERENEGTSRYEAYWEQNASESHLSLLSVERRVRHELCSSSVATSSLILHLLPGFECKTSYEQVFNIQKNFYLNRSCLRQNTIVSDRKMYFDVICAQGR